MKNYSELTDTPLALEINIHNKDDYTVLVDNIEYSNPTHLSLLIDNRKSFSIKSTIIIDNINIDNINIIPTYNHLVNYIEGKWALTFDGPFYCWLHQAQNQGWLLEPNPVDN